MVWATLTLIPYIEGTRFVVRTDHNALRWMMTTNDPQGRLMRWRFRMMEFDYEIVYRSGRVHQVPDALSRLLKEGGTKDDATIDEEIPSFGDQHQVQIEPSHSVQVVTRARSGKAPSVGAASTAQKEHSPPSETEPMDESTVIDPNPIDLPPERECLRLTKPLVRPRGFSSLPASTAWNDTSLIALPGDEPEVDDVDDLLLDLQRLVKERQPCGALQLDEVLSTPLSKQKLCKEQKLDDFCQSVHTTQLSRKETLYFEDEDGMLYRRHPRDQTMIQAVLPSSLRHRLLRLAHHTPFAGHPGQTRLHRRLQRSYYWPHMAADISATVRECTPCAKNRLRLLRKASEMKLFPATAPLDSVAIDILGPLLKSAGGYIFMLVISERFTKLSQVVPLKRIIAYDVAVAFVKHWMFKYGAPATLLSDNGSQFVAHFFRRVCNILQVHNVFTTTYHPQTNGQVERFNRTLAAMLRCYFEDNPGLWCLYAPALCYTYTMSVHSTTGTTPFDLVLSRPPPEFTRDDRPQSRARTPRAQKSEYVQRLQVALQKASRSLQRAQARYRRDFDRGIRVTRRIQTDDYIFLDAHDGTAKRPKLTHNMSGPFRVLGHDNNNIVIQRGEVVERVSRDRVTLAPKQASTKAARMGDAQTKHLQAKRTSGRSYTFSKILGHRELQNGDLEFKISWDDNYKPTWEPRDCVP